MLCLLKGIKFDIILLGIQFEKKPTFDDHISDICRKTDRTISPLIRVTTYMGTAKKRILVTAFFSSQFSYCPLVWMCDSPSNNKKIN